MVEDKKRVREHKKRVGDAKDVGRGIAKSRLELGDCIIGKIADHTTREGWKRRIGYGFKRGHFSFKGGKNIVWSGQSACFAAIFYGDFLPMSGENTPRSGSDDGPTSAFVGGFGTF